MLSGSSIVSMFPANFFFFSSSSSSSSSTLLVLLALLLLLVQHHVAAETGQTLYRANKIMRDSSSTMSSNNSINDDDFVRTSGIRFVKKGNEPFYFNGFNAYWLMWMGSNNNNNNNPDGGSSRGNVTFAFQQATKYGMTVARTWAFSDGGSNPLQSSPGVYNEDMFKGLDFVLSEARKYRIKVILSLVNNYPDFGGRKQYVQWAKDQGGEGSKLTSEDDFYTNPVVKSYYKNHVKAVVGRVNTISGVTYKDDPTIFSWELINEPRCETDLSGATLQQWIQEMAAHVKSIDKNHLVEVGLEGFYGESKKQHNPKSYLFGSDFISNNQIPQIDFSTIHVYPDIWLPGSDQQAQIDFAREWLQVHIQDSSQILKKPLVLSEFGKSSKVKAVVHRMDEYGSSRAREGGGGGGGGGGGSVAEGLGSYNVSQRDSYFSTLYDQIYASASSGGPCNGGLFWQMLGQGMDGLKDGYEVILPESPSTANIIARQSKKLSQIR